MGQTTEDACDAEVKSGRIPGQLHHPPAGREEPAASPGHSDLSEITYHTRGQATCFLDGKTVVKYPHLSCMEDRNFTFNSVGFLLIQQFCLGTAQKIIAVVFRKWRHKALC